MNGTQYYAEMANFFLRWYSHTGDGQGDKNDGKE